MKNFFKAGLLFMQALSLCVLSSQLLASTSLLPQVIVEADYYKVNFLPASLEDRSELAGFIHIDHISELGMEAHLSGKDVLLIKKKFPHLITNLERVSDSTSHGTGDSPQGDEIEYPAADTEYHTYLEMLEELKQVEKEFPHLAQLFSLGKSVEGQDIPGIRLTVAENRKTSAFLPGILFIGSHHAREHLSTEIPLKLIRYLVQSYGKDPAITAHFQNRDIYFVPMLNPDGAMHDIKGRKYKYWRKNRTHNSDGTFGVDLNRNYGFQWGTGGSSKSPSSDVFMGPSPFSEPESSAVRTFIENHSNVRILLSFHTYSELILYPWGHSHQGVGGRDEQVFKHMAQTMSQWNKYKPQQSSQLYIASGDTCDWAYGEHGIFCFTFELTPKNDFFGRGFYPGVSVINPTFQVNIPAALYLIDLADDPHRSLGISASGLKLPTELKL